MKVMARASSWIGVAITTIVVVGTAMVFLASPPGGTPSLEDCVGLWNASGNGERRRLVVTEDFSQAAVDALESEGRYEGCAFTFGQAPGPGRWLAFYATRLPGRDSPLRFSPPERGLGSDFRTPLEALNRLDYSLTSEGKLFPG